MNIKMRKFISKLGLIALVIISGITTLMAEEIKPPLFSEWSKLDLDKFDRYGILKNEWVDDGMMKTIDEITFYRLSELVSIKFAQIPGTKLKRAPITVTTIEDEITKREVLDMLYTCLMSYEYNKELNTDNKDVVTYMTELGIVKGDGKDLGLDKPCTKEVAVIMAGRLVEAIYDIFDADSKGLFWKVENNGNIVYILGTIHFGTTSMYPMSDKIENAYDESDALVVETNKYAESTVESGRERIQHECYTDGTTIKDYISEEYYNKLTDVLAQYDRTVESFGTIKKWKFTNTIIELGIKDTHNSSHSPSLIPVVDVHSFWILHNLIEQKKPILQLEGSYYESELLDSMGEELTNLVFEQTVEDELLELVPSYETLNAEMQSYINWNNYWNTGNVEALSAELSAQKVDISEVNIDEELLPIVEQQLETFNTAMWETRDTNMTNDIESMLSGEGSTTYFVTVDAGHCVSDTGIIKQLEERGYTVTQIK